MKLKQDSEPQHIPVMVSEVLSYLNICPNGIYFDGTIGLGGHTKHILSHLNKKGTLIGIDRDGEALEICRTNLQNFSSSILLLQTSFEIISDILNQQKIPTVNGILLDLGLSSFQLDSNNRGFSFAKSGPLDMRFDSSYSRTVSDLIQDSSTEELALIIRDFGEERHAKRIAKTMKKGKPVRTVEDLVEVIRRTTPPAHRNRTFARVFQAFRIAVNQELDRLKTFLNNFIDCLTIGGRIVIISYHSLEDRLVKHAFKNLSLNNRLSIHTKKPLTPSEDECFVNRRSKSAKLRSGERIS
jgi:16S rRNA (cytosine1402-N4)-methyltransferase